ncbi:hypothetical protein DICVIV_09050 [Dictyocaulus viviparus]|uniref:Unspecific monooxygenase n=1 Tax=Dictyocaulus viviparus TaxID=29172 RepID=A0A0D8XMC2_DICVI|nr:hypothetical protein DICVIV_09050 [Dictyocaulus viviparus]
MDRSSIRTSIGNALGLYHSLDAEPRDYTDAFLLRMKEDCKNGVKYSSFDNESLVVNIMDLWIAGQETTSTTILWGLIYLLRNPEVVNNVRKELLKVTGGSRSLSLSDKSETPYFLATIAFDPSRFLSEPSLLSSVIPFGIGRRACLGESLARAELYLIIGNLLLRYAIQSIDEKPSIDVINKFGIMKKPKPYKIKITKIV